MFDLCLDSLYVEKGNSRTQVVPDTLKSFPITELSLRSLNFNCLKLNQLKNSVPQLV